MRITLRQSGQGDPTCCFERDLTFTIRAKAITEATFCGELEQPRTLSSHHRRLRLAREIAGTRTTNRSCQGNEWWSMRMWKDDPAMSAHSLSTYCSYTLRQPRTFASVAIKIFQHRVMETTLRSQPTAFTLPPSLGTHYPADEVARHVRSSFRGW